MMEWGKTDAEASGIGIATALNVPVACVGDICRQLWLLLSFQFVEHLFKTNAVGGSLVVLLRCKQTLAHKS